MATPRFAGFYVPGSIIITIGAPKLALGVQAEIPNLPPEAAFPFILSGRVSDEFVTAAQNVDTTTLQVGLDGEAVGILTFDKSGTITLNVMRSSTLNVALTFAHKAMSNPIAPLLFTMPISIKDPNAPGSLVDGRNCFLQRSADLSYGASEGTNTWTFHVPEIDIAHGARVF